MFSEGNDDVFLWYVCAGSGGVFELGDEYELFLCASSSAMLAEEVEELWCHVELFVGEFCVELSFLDFFYECADDAVLFFEPR